MAGGHQWKHGWIPLTPSAVASKNHGRKPGSGSKLGKLMAGGTKSPGKSKVDSKVKTGPSSQRPKKPHRKSALEAARKQHAADKQLYELQQRHAEDRRREAAKTPDQRIAETMQRIKEGGEQREREHLAEARRAVAKEAAEEQWKRDNYEAARQRGIEARREGDARRAKEKAAKDAALEKEAAEESARRHEGARIARLGAALFKNGEYQKAIEHFERGAQADPGRREQYEDLIRQARNRMQES